jgi:hypothetical protein
MNPSESDAAKKRNFDSARRHLSENYQGIGGVLKHRAVLKKLERLADFLLVERTGSKEIEIYGLAVAQLEGDRGPAVKYE